MQAIASLSVHRRVFVVAVLCLAVAGCATGGAVSDGRYTSPLNNFSVIVPSGLGVKVDEAYDQDSGMVSFHDDFGNLKAINYLRLPANAPAIQQDPAKWDTAYRGFLHDYIVPNWFEPVSQNTSVAHEKFVTVGTESDFFAVAEIPEGSAMADGKTGKRLDSRRAVLVFAKNGFMYMLSHELMTAFNLGKKFTIDDKALAGAVNALYDFKASIRFQ